MVYGIFTSAGNLVAWCKTERDATAVLADLVRDDPEAADEIAAIPFDVRGHACGPAIEGSATLAPAAESTRDGGRREHAVKQLVVDGE